MDENDIKRLITKLNRILVELDARNTDLKENRTVFTNQYGTTDNQYFNNQNQILNNVEDILKKFQNLLVQMSPSITRGQKHYLNHTGNKLDPFSRCWLTSSVTQVHLFQKDYPECVNELSECFTSVMKYLHLCLQSCIDTINDEERIKTDPEESNKRFKWNIDCYENYPRVNIEKNNPAIIEFIRCNYNEDLFGSGHYHLYNMEQVIQLVFFVLDYRRKKNGYTDLETNVFRNDVAALEKCRYLIDHFDEMIPQRNAKNKTIKGKYMYEFIEKYMMHNGQVSLTDAYKCFCERYERIPGKHKLVSYERVHECRTSKTTNGGQSDDTQVEKCKRKVMDLPCFRQNLDEWERSYLAGYGHDMKTAESLQSHDGFHATNEQVLRYSPL
ncbi:MAG: hypothetical protein ACI4TK_12095 [Agathobacter sp.]